MRSKVFTTLTLVLCLALVACGGAPRAPTSAPPAKEVSTSVPARPTSTPVSVQPTAPQVEDYELDQASDLSRLNSYRTRYSMKWDTTKDGQKETGSWDVQREYVRQPPAHRTLWTSLGAGQGDTFELIQIGTDSYMRSGSEWIASTSSDQDLFAGNQFMTDPFGAIAGEKGKLVRRGESANGVSCDHYAFDEGTLGSPFGMVSVTKAKGDTWVSTEFQVVVKYTVHYEGSGLAIGGTGGDGTLDIAFDVTDINKPISIQAPEGVKPAMPQDIPILEGATEVSAMAGVVSFKTTKTVEEVAAFYTTQLLAQGWTKDEGQTPEIVSFTKGSRTAQIMLTAEGGKTRVIIITQDE
jgi:hypothetical protein